MGDGLVHLMRALFVSVGLHLFKVLLQKLQHFPALLGGVGKLLDYRANLDRWQAEAFGQPLDFIVGQVAIVCAILKSEHVYILKVMGSSIALVQKTHDSALFEVVVFAIFQRCFGKLLIFIAIADRGP